MSRFTIRHETRYDYDNAVAFGPHSLLLRPRDSHAIRLHSANLTLSPPGETRWSYDALGNCVCRFTPQGEATSFSVVSELVLERFPAPIDLYPVRDPQSAMPVDYALTDRIALAPFMTPTSDDIEGVLPWLRDQLGAIGEPAMAFLLRLTQHICGHFDYQAREAEGVQTPAQTLAFRSGSCRDYAWLMVEALRHVGFAARFVTGYLYSAGIADVRGAGATHAWAEVFLPDLGWLQFDPTNGIAESPDLIAVAAARTPAEAAPVAGTIIGNPGGSRLTVAVDVRLEEPQPA
jgi:YD repeat-containing protein